MRLEIASLRFGFLIRSSLTRDVSSAVLTSYCWLCQLVKGRRHALGTQFKYLTQVAKLWIWTKFLIYKLRIYQTGRRAKLCYPQLWGKNNEITGYLKTNFKTGRKEKFERLWLLLRKTTFPFYGCCMCRENFAVYDTHALVSALNADETFFLPHEKVNSVRRNRSFFPFLYPMRQKGKGRGNIGKVPGKKVRRLKVNRSKLMNLNCSSWNNPATAWITLNCPKLDPCERASAAGHENRQ